MSNKKRSKRYDVASKKEVEANERREQRMTPANACALALGVLVWVIAFAFPELLYVFGGGVANLIKFVALVAIVLALVAQRRGYKNIFNLLAVIKESLFPTYEYDEYEEDEPVKRVCAKCGNEVPEGDQCCGKCGTKYVPKPEPAKRICAKCGNEVSAENEYCGKCGTKYEPVKRICAKCGKEVRPENQYCGNCGTEYVPQV